MNKKTSPLRAVVKKVLLSGLVVEVEGEDGFVPRRELDWNDLRIDPTAHFKTGQEIPVVVIKTSEGDGARFSRKLAIKDPWADKVEKYEAELKANRFPVVRGVVRLEDALDIVLRSLCKKTDGQVKAVVLRMDLTTQEIHCMRSYSLDEISWPDHKSTLRYTPIENVIRWDEPLMEIAMPESGLDLVDLIEQSDRNSMLFRGFYE